MMAEPISTTEVLFPNLPPRPEKGKAPRPLAGEKLCSMPGCEVKFAPRSINSLERFCCAKHKQDYWHMAAQLGDKILRGDMGVSGKSQGQCVLELLQSYAGRWVDRPIARLPFVNWNVISRLRKRGYDIQCRMIFRDDLQRREYQYRLVVRDEC